jgi:hypothetical protein
MKRRKIYAAIVSTLYLLAAAVVYLASNLSTAQQQGLLSEAELTALART